MRSEQELNSPEFNDDMSELVALLTKENIPFTIKPHLGSTEKVKEIIGYYPAGKDHIMIDHKVSVIRGFVSFGDYEIFLDKYTDPERFATPEELVADYKKRYGI